MKANLCGRWRGTVVLVLVAASLPLAWSDVGSAVRLWPVVVGLSGVFLLRRAFTGLVLGAFAGAVLLAGGDPLTGFRDLIGAHLLPAFESRWNIGAILFTLILGGFAALLEKGGALHAFFARVGATGSPRRVQAGAAGLGIVCFFDGLASALLAGRLFRPLADRARVSRVKLAYIVDSTGSAVACVAFISTWIAFQLSMIRQGYAMMDRGETVNPFALYFSSIPFNFYSWFTLLLVGLVVWRRWDIGPMRAFERAAREGPVPELDGSGGETAAPPWRAFLPLTLLIGGILVGLYLSGREPGAGLTLGGIALAFGEADAPLVLVGCSVAAALLAGVLMPPRPGGGAAAVFQGGVLNMAPPIFILMGAWMLGSVLADLEAAQLLSQWADGRVSPAMFPATVFLIGALTSFCTGTSWGTMGLLMPLVLPVGIEMGDGGASAVLMPALVAAVFSGAVFGDHCSPVSDTTIVSSAATGIEPRDHVRTQLPYALLAGGVALVLGFGLAVAVEGPWISLVAGAVALGAVVSVGSRAEAGG